jgi:hypothetical protein
MPDIKPIAVRLPDDMQAKYVNMVRVTHTPGEFILDFTAILPGVKDAKVDARIILSPLGFKLMQQAVSENLRRYEATFGEIRLPTGGHSLAEDLFRGPGEQEPPKQGQ